ncbi:unnamed protein product [Soboliphyme baturini]|uniref:SCP domain-containing protein n=1 Tax=Soboliphyme baturini TaxID=241478 RepID=A0A183J625_9BILA|nr:unnamed protein product [Soboliphyme baturini]
MVGSGHFINAMHVPLVSYFCPNSFWSLTIGAALIFQQHEGTAQCHCVMAPPILDDHGVEKGKVICLALCCGHVVWAESHKVGCGFTKCSKIKNAPGHRFILVCHYFPSGNVLNSKGPCSDCSERHSCVNGLCDATTSG